MDMSLPEWLQIIYIVCGMIVTGLGFLIPLLKSEKAKKTAQTALKIAEAVQPYIVEAENFVNYTGEEKLNFVVTKANQYALSHKLKFDAVAVTKKIEELVTLTKQVNKREKDIEAEKLAEVEEINLEVVSEQLNTVPVEEVVAEVVEPIIETPQEKIIEEADIIVEEAIVNPDTL